MEKSRLKSFDNPFKGSKLKIKKDTLTLIQEFKLYFNEKEKKTLIFKIPHYPFDIKKEKLIRVEWF